MAISKKNKIGNNETLVRIPVASGTVIELDDHVKVSGGKAVRVTAASDNLTFRGIAREEHNSTDPSGNLLVSLPNANQVYEVELDSSSNITFGDNLALHTDGKKLTASDTDPVAVAAESKLSATKIRCFYKLINVTSGFLAIGDAS